MPKKQTKATGAKLLDEVLGGVEKAQAAQDDPGAAPTAETPPEAKTEASTSPKDDQPAAETIDAKCERLTKRLERIEKARRRLAKHQNQVEQTEQHKKAADAKLKAAIGERDKAVREMERVIDDDRAGQAPLPGMEDADDEPAEITDATPAETTTAGTAQEWPISELGAKQLAKIVGAETFQAAKDRDEPIGLSPDQLGKLEAAEIATIGDLEKQMREKRDWWQIVAKAQDAKIVTRVVDSLGAFRRAHPESEGRPETVVERLAAKNAAPTPLAALAAANGIEAI